MTYLLCRRPNIQRKRQRPNWGWTTWVACSSYSPAASRWRSSSPFANSSGTSEKLPSTDRWVDIWRSLARGVPSLSPGHTDPHPIVPWWSIWRRLCLNLSDFNHLTFSKLFDFTAFVSKMHSVCWYWHRCKNKPPLWYLEERSLWNSGDKSVRLKFIV